jgi:hypothetical protein
MIREEWLAKEIEAHKRGFDKGDYSEFMQALLLSCWNKRPLEDWIADVVI